MILVTQNKLEEGEPRNMGEFTQYAMRTLHDALLKEGAVGMHKELYVILPYYLNWNKRCLAK